jgi:hypothetical protein
MAILQQMLKQTRIERLPCVLVRHGNEIEQDDAKVHNPK